jgi:hypothetical protein
MEYKGRTDKGDLFLRIFLLITIKKDRNERKVMISKKKKKNY